MMPGSDTHEGVRALLVDKDNKPQWNPPKLDQVDASTVDKYFASLGQYDLQL